MRQIISFKALFVGAAIGLSACGGGNSDTGALLDLNNSPAATAVRKIVLDCPTSALSGKVASGFTATLTNAAGVAVPNTFVGIAAAVAGAPAGTIIANKPTGGTNLGGANTNTAGKVIFAFQAPTGVTKATAATVTATVKPTTGDPITGTCDISITPNPVKLSIRGPGAQPSGTVTLQAGQSARGFTAAVVDSVNDPVPDITLTFTAKNDTDVTTGRVRTPQGNITDANGLLSFDYTSPSTIREESDVTITATGNANGNPLTAGFIVVVTPPPPDPVAPTLTVTAPNGSRQTVAALSTTDGFVATLLDETGTGVSGTTVNLTLTDSGSNDAGTLLTASGGTPTRTSFVTNSNGEIRFRYKAPRASTTQRVTLDASYRFGTDTIEAQAPVVLTVTKISAPVLTAEGPNGEPSGAIQIATGTPITGLLATLVDGNGEPVVARQLSFTPSVGTVTTPNGLSTDGVGQVEFDYRAPAGVTTSTNVTIRVDAAGVDGVNPTASYNLTVTPTPPEASPTMAIVGPSEALPGQSKSGFTLSFKRDNGEPLEGAKVRFTTNPTSNQISVLAADGTEQPGNTVGTVDAFGEVDFNVKPSTSSGASDTTFTITASVESNGTRASVVRQCTSDADAVCTASKIVTVRADRFGFVAPPAYGASAPTGRDQGTKLNFEWKDAGNVGVSGCLDLTMTAPGGSTGGKFGLIVAGDPTSPTERKRVLLNSSGNFDTADALAAFSDSSGFSEITATENRNCSDTVASNARKSTTALQFVDAIPTREFNVTLRGQSDSMILTRDTQLPLSVEVLNDASQPLDNIKVQFGFCQTATTPKANNEEITPGGGTTNADGKATTTYLLPSSFASGQPANSTVRITACIDGSFTACSDTGSNVCDTFDIFLKAPTP